MEKKARTRFEFTAVYKSGREEVIGGKLSVDGYPRRDDKKKITALKAFPMVVSHSYKEL